MKEPLKVYRDGVGKYLKLQAVAKKPETSLSSAQVAKKKKLANGFGNFSSW